MTHVSDSYLSQVERGLYEPSPEVLKSIADALNLPISSLYERLGWLDDEPDGARREVPGVEQAIEADEKLTWPRSEPCWRCIAPSSERPEGAHRRGEGRQARQVLDLPSSCVAY